LNTKLFWAITQQVVVNSYRRFGTAYRSSLRESRIQRTLKMGPMGCSETSVTNYHHSLRNSPEERSSHTLHDGSLNSYTDLYEMST